MLSLRESVNGVPMITTESGAYGGIAGGGIVIPPLPTNMYSMLTIPAYRRAIDVKASTLATFARSVRQNDLTLETPHPLDKLLQLQPNGYQTGTKLWLSLYFHWSHYNNGYLQIQRDPRTLKPIALHNILPETVEPFRILYNDGSIEQWYGVFMGKPAVLPFSDVIHVSGLSYDGQCGIHPLLMSGSTLQRAAMLDRFQTRYLQHGTVIRGTLEFEKEIKPERIAQIKELVRDQFRGTEFESDILILTDGGKLNNSTITPEDGQLVQQQVMSNKQIAQITGVPPQFLYENTEAKYVNSVEQVGRDVLAYTFMPMIDQIEDELTLKLLSDAERAAGYHVNLDPSVLVKADAKGQTDIVNALVAAGICTQNEGRKMLGMPKINDPEADKLKVRGDNAVKLPAAQQDKQT